MEFEKQPLIYKTGATKQLNRKRAIDDIDRMTVSVNEC